MLLRFVLILFLLTTPLSSYANHHAFYQPRISKETLAITPPMGWNSWNHFGATITDELVRAQADALVASGMRDVGYKYVIIDDSWEGKRDANGIIHPNEKFPDMKALTDYIHSKGLKLGIYSSPGPQTCLGYEGSYGHEEQDAQTFAEWGVDYLKYDLCSFSELMKKEKSEKEAHQLMVNAYSKMNQALLKTGRPIVYSLCQYGLDDVWEWGKSVGGHLWRTTGDMIDNYYYMTFLGFNQAGLSKYAGPGYWNDPDMLEIGNGGMTTEEYRTHMSLWVLLAAPLIAGNDLTQMTPETIALLTNTEVIAVDQDPAGKQGDRLKVDDVAEIWSKLLADGSEAVGLFNLTESSRFVRLNFSDLGMDGVVFVRDLWRQADLGNKMKQFEVEIPAHGVVLLRIQKA